MRSKKHGELTIGETMLKDSSAEDIPRNILDLNKAAARMLTGVITGHLAVNTYLQRIGARDDPVCDGCTMGRETAEHLCYCANAQNGPRLEETE